MKRRIILYYFLLLSLLSNLCLFNLSAQENNIKQTKPVYVIPIHGEINRAMMVFIRRGIDKAKEAKAETIIFDINTFGGGVDSALQIATIIGSVNTAETVALILASPEGTGVSWSAGALIAFSCSRIYMSPGTSIGAAAPVYQTQKGMEMAPEKVVSAVRTQMAALAEKNGYPVCIALAMVDEDVELVEVFLDNKMELTTSDELDELKRKAVENNKKFVTGKTISKQGKLLTLTAGQMEKYNVSSGTVSNIEILFGLFNIQDSGSQVVFIRETIPDKIVTMITGSLITGILIMLGMIALYMEITSPGFGVPGTIAIICFATIFSGGVLLGTVGSLEFLIFLLGVSLLVVEIFLIPGFGVTGISGILLIMGSLVLSRQDFILPKWEWEWQWNLFFRNILVVGISFVLSILFITLIMRLFNRLPVFKYLILTSAEKRSAGFTVQTQDISNELLGQKGVAVTRLRPVGKAEINNQLLVVETDGEFLEKKARLEVIEVSGNRIIVRGLSL